MWQDVRQSKTQTPQRHHHWCVALEDCWQLLSWSTECNSAHSNFSKAHQAAACRTNKQDYAPKHEHACACLGVGKPKKTCDSCTTGRVHSRDSNITAVDTNDMLIARRDSAHLPPRLYQSIQIQCLAADVFTMLTGVPAGPAHFYANLAHIPSAQSPCCLCLMTVFATNPSCYDKSRVVPPFTEAGRACKPDIQEVQCNSRLAGSCAGLTFPTSTWCNTPLHPA